MMLQRQQQQLIREITIKWLAKGEAVFVVVVGGVESDKNVSSQ
jgi:hypothetical protein